MKKLLVAIIVAALLVLSTATVFAGDDNFPCPFSLPAPIEII